MRWIMIALLLMGTVACQERLFYPAEYVGKDIQVEDSLFKNGDKFHEGMVIDMRHESECSYLITLEAGDTINPDKLFTRWQRDSLPVWVKFTKSEKDTHLCKQGEPVKITGIAERSAS